jgi:hypothetical protein
MSVCLDVSIPTLCEVCPTNNTPLKEASDALGTAALQITEAYGRRSVFAFVPEDGG